MTKATNERKYTITYLANTSLYQVIFQTEEILEIFFIVTKITIKYR